jgi:hypothetical protein
MKNFQVEKHPMILNKEDKNKKVVWDTVREFMAEKSTQHK